MFEAKVYTISIPSSGVVLEEEHIARDVITRWNYEEGEKRGVAFITIPNNRKDITPDLIIFAIDNYVDEQKVEAAIATGAKVILFFRRQHDEKNTMESEVKAIAKFRNKVQDKCTCVDYSNHISYEKELESAFSSQL